MNASKLALNWAIRFRRSSNPKLMLGSESATDGASALARGGLMPLVESDGSNDEDIATGLVNANSVVLVLIVFRLLRVQVCAQNTHKI